MASLGEPVQVLEKLFYCFKGIQITVFLGWCYFYGKGCLLPASGIGCWLGAALIVMGQGLNLSVFYRLEKIGVFYGKKLGYEVPWCQRFPFSVLTHPQYVGTLLSIWGFFLVMRFPHGD
jgi:methylene-fatty-acyl-phospholipid synthase